MYNLDSIIKGWRELDRIGPLSSVLRASAEIDTNFSRFFMIQLLFLVVIAPRTSSEANAAGYLSTPISAKRKSMTLFSVLRNQL